MTFRAIFSWQVVASLWIFSRKKQHKTLPSEGPRLWLKLAYHGQKGCQKKGQFFRERKTTAGNRCQWNYSLNTCRISICRKLFCRVKIVLVINLKTDLIVTLLRYITEVILNRLQLRGWWNYLFTQLLILQQYNSKFN